MVGVFESEIHADGNFFRENGNGNNIREIAGDSTMC
jgi:hypothetical protein